MKLKNFKKSILLGAAALCCSTLASAGINLAPGIAHLEDNNIEYVIDVDGNIQFPGNGYQLKVGDRLRTVFEIENSKTISGSVVQDLGGAQELTGLAEIQITAIIPTGISSTIVFGPSPSFIAEVGVPGAVVVMYEQAAGDLDMACQSGTLTPVADCEAAAINGNHWLTAGFGDADDFWLSLGAATSIDAVAVIPGSQNIGSANFGLTVLANNTGYQLEEQSCAAFGALTGGAVCNDDGLTDLTGSGSILGGDLLNGPFFARSDFDFYLNRLPEPTPVALLGLGLVLLSLSKRKRR